MIIIRLKPGGKKHQRRFRIVLTEKRRKLTGKIIKVLGWYDPQRKEYSLEKEEIKKYLVKKYLDKGAQISDTVYNLLVKERILPGPKRRVHKTKKKESSKKGEEQAEEEKKEAGGDKEKEGGEMKKEEEKVPEGQSGSEKDQKKKNSQRKKNKDKKNKFVRRK